MIKTIRLYGKLGYRFGRVHRMDVASPAEAVRALCSQLRGFKQFLLDSKGGYAVFVGKRNIAEGELRDPSGGEDIRIAPFAVGAKSEWVQVIVGIVLVVVGYVLTAFGYGAIGMPISNLGWGLIAGGIAQLLIPNPKVNGPSDKAENMASTQFSGPVNTQAQGNIVPVMYGGPVIVGSAVVSAGIEAKDNAYVPRYDRSDRDTYGGGSTQWNSETQAP
jgi:predicted phage tail protein